MTFIQKLINRLFLNKIITYKVSDLIDNVSNERLQNIYMYICIQTENDSRRFFYVTIDELIILFQNSESIQRSLYELILPTKQVKAYIDFDYYTKNNTSIKNSYTGPCCILKILYYFLNVDQTNTMDTNDRLTLALKQFLVLES